MALSFLTFLIPILFLAAAITSILLVLLIIVKILLLLVELYPSSATSFFGQNTIMTLLL